MNNLYTKEYLRHIKEQVDIVDIVSQYLPLKQYGQLYKACCPFHDEKTPSFVVSSATEEYFCYGCQAHGDVIAFLMNYMRLTFKESIEYLENYVKNKEKKKMSIKVCEKDDVRCFSITTKVTKKQNEQLEKILNSKRLSTNSLGTYRITKIDLISESIQDYINKHKEEVKYCNGEQLELNLGKNNITFTEKNRREVDNSVEENLLMQCCKIMDSIKNEKDDELFCTASEFERKYKVMSQEKIKYINKSKNLFKCEECMCNTGSHIFVKVKKFIRWIMENSHQYNFLLPRHKIPSVSA